MTPAELDAPTGLWSGGLVPAGVICPMDADARALIEGARGRRVHWLSGGGVDRNTVGSDILEVPRVPIDDIIRAHPDVHWLTKAPIGRVAEWALGWTVGTVGQLGDYLWYATTWGAWRGYPPAVGVVLIETGAVDR